MNCTIQLGFASLNGTFHLSPHENILYHCTHKHSLFVLYSLYTSMVNWCSTIVAMASWSGCEAEGTLQLFQQELPCNAVAAEYPQHTLTATPTCSSHSGVVLYETYVASQRNLEMSVDILDSVCTVGRIPFNTKSVGLHGKSVRLHSLICVMRIL